MIKHNAFKSSKVVKCISRCQIRNYFHFELIHQSSRSNARVGRIHTPHGIIDTPNFVAVGTNGAIKGPDMVFMNEHVDMQLMFCKYVVVFIV
jgi:queuine tRNA-ribosyltransferase